MARLTLSHVAPRWAAAPAPPREPQPGSAGTPTRSEAGLALCQRYDVVAAKDASERVALLRSTLDPLARSDEALALPLAALAMAYAEAGHPTEAGLLMGFATRPAGTWSSSAGVAGRWLGTLRTTSGRGASLSSALATTNLMQVVGDRCPACGQMQVYLDGVLRATVDSHAATTLTRQVLWSSPTLSFTAHRLRLVNLATATRPQLHIDAVSVGR